MGSRSNSVGGGLSGVGGGGSGVGNDSTMSEEERAIAEAIRLSMLDAQPSSSSAAASSGDDAVERVTAMLSNQIIGDGGEHYELEDGETDDEEDDGALPGVSGFSSSAGRGEVSGAAAAVAPPPAPAKASHLPSTWEEWAKASHGEPPKGTVGTTRIQLRLATGKTIVRRFYADSDPVAAIYAVAIHHVRYSDARPPACLPAHPVLSCRLTCLLLVI